MVRAQARLAHLLSWSGRKSVKKKHTKNVGAVLHLGVSGLLCDGGFRGIGCVAMWAHRDSQTCARVLTVATVGVRGRRLTDRRPGWDRVLEKQNAFGVDKAGQPGRGRGVEGRNMFSRAARNPCRGGSICRTVGHIAQGDEPGPVAATGNCKPPRHLPNGSGVRRRRQRGISTSRRARSSEPRL
jgi:hypothetical protein